MKIEEGKVCRLSWILTGRLAAAEDYALALEKDQPGAQGQMARGWSGSLRGSWRGSRQNSEALPESSWRVPALHSLGNDALGDDSHGHAVEVLSDSSASPSPRPSLQPGTVSTGHTDASCPQQRPLWIQDVLLEMYSNRLSGP